MSHLQVLIVEDEKPAARQLKNMLLAERPGAEVLAVCESVEEVVNIFKSGRQPQLAFFDIHLADGLSFSVFEQVKVTCPVIFTTAYDHYAIKAFKVNSVDYLLKPVDNEALRQALRKFEKWFQQPPVAGIDYSQLAEVLRSQSTQAYRQRFLVKAGHKLLFVQATDVAYFFSDEGQTFMVTIANDHFLLDETLEELEEAIDARHFFRISRKMIVAVSSIRKIEPHFSGRYVLELAPAFNGEVTVSRQRAADFRQWLNR